MSSIRILLNGQHQHTVSLEGHPGVLSCIVNYMNRNTKADDLEEPEDEYHMSFGGIDNTTGDYVDWPRLEIGVGDRIELEILEASDPCPPASRRPHGGDATEYSRKDYIRSMATKYGWEIIEHDTPSETDKSEDGADQPATAPELKCAGGRNPKPESEVRRA